MGDLWFGGVQCRSVMDRAHLMIGKLVDCVPVFSGLLLKTWNLQSHRPRRTVHRIEHLVARFAGLLPSPFLPICGEGLATFIQRSRW